MRRYFDPTRLNFLILQPLAAIWRGHPGQFGSTKGEA